SGRVEIVCGRALTKDIAMAVRVALAPQVRGSFGDIVQADEGETEFGGLRADLCEAPEVSHDEVAVWRRDDELVGLVLLDLIMFDLVHESQPSSRWYGLSSY